MIPAADMELVRAVLRLPESDPNPLVADVRAWAELHRPGFTSWRIMRCAYACHLYRQVAGESDPSPC